MHTKMTDEQCYREWLRRYPEVVRATCDLLKAGERPMDVLGSMAIDGATTEMLTLTRRALRYARNRDA